MGSPQADISRGREAMMYFHNRASSYSSYDLTFDQLLDKVGGGGPKTSIFVEGLGLAVEQVGISSGKLQDAMEALADAGAGRLPSNQHAFFRAISDEVQNINWVAAVPSIAVGVASDFAHGVAEGGQSVITVLKSLNTVLPLIVVGGVAWVVIQKFKKAGA